MERSECVLAIRKSERRHKVLLVSIFSAKRNSFWSVEELFLSILIENSWRRVAARVGSRTFVSVFGLNWLSLNFVELVLEELGLLEVELLIRTCVVVLHHLRFLAVDCVFLRPGSCRRRI